MAGGLNPSQAQKKEYRLLDNSLTVLGAAVCAFAAVPLVQTIVIAIPENDEKIARQSLPPGIFNVEKPEILFAAGGETRRASVYNALALLKGRNPGYVLIHDGARPWVSVPLIERIIDAVKKYNAVIPIVPITDTPKECESPFWELQQENPENDGSPAFIKSHLKRANTGAAQTPQAFAFPQILYAHEKAAKLEQEEFTDDAEVWGKFYGPVAAIAGEQKNLKITFPQDLL